MAMETASFLHDLRARSQADPGLRSRLLADPGAALRDLGLALPGGRSLAVVEDTETQVHLPLPPAGAGPLPEAGPDGQPIPKHALINLLLAQAARDPGFRPRLLADPAAAFRDLNLAIGAGYTYQVLEDTDTLVHLALPPEGSASLTDAELETVQGGFFAPAPTPAKPGGGGISSSDLALGCAGLLVVGVVGLGIASVASQPRAF